MPRLAASAIFSFLWLIGCISPEAPASRSETPGLYDGRSGIFRLTTAHGDTLSFRCGPIGLLPLSGDWDGDGLDSVGLFYPATGAFLLADLNAANSPTSFVESGWSPVAAQPISGDWDGDGRDGVGIFDPVSLGFLLLDAPARSSRRRIGGEAIDTPARAIAGDWRGIGRDGVGVYLPTEGEFVLWSPDGETERVVGAPRSGLAAAADLDGDGRSELLVFDRATGVVWSRVEGADFIEALHLGPSAALPVFGRWAVSSAPAG